MERNIYRDGLDRSAANFCALSPVSFLARSAIAFPEKTAVIDGERRFNYRELNERARRLASALRRRGLGDGDTVAVLASNGSAMIEAHFGIPMAGAVLNALNTRLDAATIGFCLKHGEAKLVIVDSEYLPLMEQALSAVGMRIPIIVITAGNGEMGSAEDYESLLGTGDPSEALPELTDEWSAISLGYTSGTTGEPKGVVCHHRGAYLNALGNALAAHLDEDSVYLWTLPMFHCNGWSHIWAVTAVGGVHVCMRKVDPVRIYELAERESVTHLSAAPVILTMLAEAAEGRIERLRAPVRILTGGSTPPGPVMSAIERLGFVVMHIYGMTETTGPSLICEWHREWDALSLAERMELNARQGINLVTMQEAIVADGTTCRPVASDGKEIGEIMLRGSTVMMGYLKDPAATGSAMADGWFRTGDLAVRHPDGYIEIRDRAKDIIISGGENISSVEVEGVLYRHPAIREAAVVARPDDHWGEHPCAFVDLRGGAANITADELRLYCRTHLAGFKVPRTFVFGPLPKTSTGKVQKYLLREWARNLEAGPEAKTPV